MATKARRPKKPKLRGGTNRPAEPVRIENTGDPTIDAAYAEIQRPETNGHIAEPVEEVLATAAAKALDAAGFKVEHPALDPAKAYDSPERLAEWDAETVLKVNESARECADYRADHEAKAEVAKDAKKAYELAVADHFKLVDQRKAGRGQPVQQELFDRTAGHAAAEPDLREPGEVPAPTDDSWRAVPLTELVEHDGLPAKVAQLLADAGLHTMAELSGYTLCKANGWAAHLTDIKGIGPGAHDKIEAATARFWARWKPHADATRPEDAGTGQQPGDGEGAGAADRGPGGDGTAPAEPEPAGYHTEGTERIAKRARGKRKAK